MLSMTGKVLNLSRTFLKIPNNGRRDHVTVALIANNSDLIDRKKYQIRTLPDGVQNMVTNLPRVKVIRVLDAFTVVSRQIRLTYEGRS